MGTKICLHDYTENKEIIAQNETNKENSKNTKNDKVYSGEGIFKPNEKTEIIRLDEEYKEINILSFNERKEKAKKLLLEGTEKSLKKALKYDNSSFNIINKNKEFLENNNLLDLFFENRSKIQFENLIMEILNSNKWDNSQLSEAFQRYKNELKNRIKFNQPIDTDNEVLFFYNSKIHILINLTENKDISQFKKILEIKRKIYKIIELKKIITKNEYPKEPNKLKLFMIILIKADCEETALYMYNSISNENEKVEYYCNKILELGLVNENLIAYDDNSIYIEYMTFNKKQYSFNSLIYCLQKNGVKKISLINECLYKYDYFLSEYWINEYFSKLEEIIKIILKSKYYSTIISELFKKKKKEIDFIQNDEFINYLILKINIIPISKDEVPFLDKFSLDIFIGGYGSESMNLNGTKSYRDQISTILKLGIHIIYIIHEGGGHFIYSYFTIISNNYYLLNSPHIKINNKLIQKESGEQVELLLFGRVISTLHLKEVLFLLNTKNHIINKNFDEFRVNFIKSNEKNYDELIEDFEGPFIKLIKSVDWTIIEDNKEFPISIASKNNTSGQPYILINRNRDDVMGRYYEELL